MEHIEGMKAPEFEAESDKGTKVRLSDFSGRRVLLYFYPKDNTPGCSLEAKNFNDNLEKLAEKGIVVLGVSGDSVKSHCSFRDKFALKFDLIADIDNKISKDYGVWVKKQNYGKEYMGIERSTFAIAADGNIEKVWRKVKAGEHIIEVMEFYGVK